MATAKKRVRLSIDKKVEVVKYAADHARGWYSSNW